MTGKQFKNWRESQDPVYEKSGFGPITEHMSQEEAGEYFGVTRNTIINWEQGHTKKGIPKSVEIVING